MTRPVFLLTLWAALFSSNACCSSRYPPEAVVLHRSVLRTPIDGMPGELEWAGVIDIGQHVAVRARIEVTSKGNGLLKVCGQEFRVYDSHDDGEIFTPSFARVVFIDIDGDGHRDLLISETVRITDESSVGSGSRFLRAYRFDAMARRFASW